MDADDLLHEADGRMYSLKEDHRRDYMPELYREEQKTKRNADFRIALRFLSELVAPAWEAAEAAVALAALAAAFGGGGLIGGLDLTANGDG